MTLLRYQVFLAYGAVFLSVWYYALQRQDDLAAIENLPKIAIVAVRWAPALAVVALGVYALIWLILGVMNFRDCPEAAAELESQVKEAKKDLRRRGIIQ